MEIEKKAEILKMFIKEQDEIISELEKELKRLRLNNLKIKLHMEVLVSHPEKKTAEKIRSRYKGKAMFSESILHYN